RTAAVRGHGRRPHRRPAAGPRHAGEAAERSSKRERAGSVAAEYRGPDAPPECGRRQSWEAAERRELLTLVDLGDDQSGYHRRQAESRRGHGREADDGSGALQSTEFGDRTARSAGEPSERRRRHSGTVAER